MGRVDSPLWTRLVKTKFRWITFSFFVGFGLAGCFGGESADEPVAAEQGAPVEGETDDAVAQEGQEGQEAQEAQEGDASDLPMAEPEEESLEGEVAEQDAPDETSPPPEVMDAASDSVSAELTADASTEFVPQPVSVEPVTEDGPEEDAAMFSQPAPVSAAVAVAPTASAIPFGTVSSPGAAANLPNAPSSSQTFAAASASSDGAAQASYIVRPGDTLATIASRIYGRMSQWQAMAAANGLIAPYVIFPGDELKYDLSSDKAKTFAQNYVHAKKHVTVKKGDTLSTLAGRLLGNPYAWKVLLTHNKDKISNPHRIPAGIELAYVDFGGGQAVVTKPAKKAVVASKPAQPAPAQKAAEAEVEEETVPAAAPAADIQPAAAAPEESSDLDAAPAAEVELDDEVEDLEEPTEE